MTPERSGGGRPIGKTLIAIGLLLAGWLAFRQLGVEALPLADAPRIYVHASLPGAGARVVSRSLVAPLERYLGRVAGIEGIYSNSSPGEAFVQLSFNHGTNIDRAARDVQQAISAATPSLPHGMPEPPAYFRYDNNVSPLLLLTMTSVTLSRERLYTLAQEALVPYLARLPGVAKVQVFGGSRMAFRVRLDTQALAAKQLTPTDVANVLRAQGVPFPLGTLREGEGSWSLSIDDGARSAAQLANLVIAQRDARQVRLGDVASVVRGPAAEANVAFSNGQPSIMVQVTKRSGANAVKTADGVRDAMADFVRSVPEPVQVHASFDLTGATRSALHEVGWTLAISVVLVLVVTLAFVRQAAQTLLIAITIPLSLAGTMLVMYAIGYTLNMLTLLSLVLCVGFVVDDAIVMVENITHHVERGMAPRQAAVRAVRELRATLVCMTASLLAALIPVVGGNGQIYVFLRQFSVTLGVSVAVSLVVSLLILPPLCAVHIRSSRVRAPWESARWLVGLVDRFLRHRHMLRWVPLAMLLLAMGMYRAVVASAGIAYMPPEDTGLIQASLASTPGATVQARTQALKEAERIVLADPAVRGVSGTVDANGAQLFIDLWSRGRGQGLRDTAIGPVVTRLSDRLGSMRSASASAASIGFLGGSAFASPSSVTAGNTFELLSYDGADLDPWVARLSRRLAHEPGFIRVQTDADAAVGEFQVHVDRDTASRLGVSMADVDNTLFDAFGDQSVSVGLGPTGGEAVMLGAAVPSATPSALLDTRVRGTSSTMMPLSAFSRVEKKVGESNILHQDQIEAAAIHFDLAPGTSMDRALEAITRAGFDVGLPPGIRIRFSGEGRMIQSLRSNSLALVMAALVAVFVVLGMLYESLVHPLTILSCLPAAGAGAFLAMWLTGTPMTTVSLIALLLLVGVVKRNAIILVNFALVAMRERGLDPVQAIREACLVRFRPIAMTSLVAIGTAIPLIVGNGDGDGVQRPLGIAIAGGLLLAQVLAFVTTPAAFLLAYDLAPAFRRLVARRPAAAAPSRHPS